MSIDYTKIETEFLNEINNLRTEPTSFIPYLESMIKSFSGNKRKFKDNIWIITNEGSSAVKEAIEFLYKQQPLEKFELNSLLTLAGRDHVKDIGPKGITGHTGSDKSSPSERIERHGQWRFTMGENIDFGSTTGRDGVISLLVDDGVSNRGHRTNIFNPNFKMIGIASGPHKEYGHCIVTPLAGGMEEKQYKDSPNKIISKNISQSTSPSKPDSKIDYSDLITGNIASKTTTKVRTTIVNGKRSSVTEKVTVDRKGKRITEIIETDDKNNIVRKELKEDMIDIKEKFDLLEIK